MVDFEILMTQLATNTCTSLSLHAEDKPDDVIFPRLWSALSQNTSLISLSIEGWADAITVDGLTAIRQLLQQNTGLQELYLNNNQLQDDSLTLLCSGLQQHPTLQILSLNGNRITVAGATLLENVLPSLKQLEILSLGGNVLENEGLKVLLTALTPVLPKLYSLSLSNNYISSEGSRFIVAWLQQTGGVKKLFLTANPLGDAGIKAIAPVLLQAHHLEWLVLKKTGLGDVAMLALIQALAQPVALKRCEIDKNPRISEKSLDQVLGSPSRPVFIQGLLAWYLERGLERYDQGYYANAVETLSKVLLLKPGHQVASFYCERAKLAALQRCLENYSQLMGTAGPSIQNTIQKKVSALVPELRTLEQHFQKTWQEALPAEKALLRPQGLALQGLWLHIVDILNKPAISRWHQVIQKRDDKQLPPFLEQGYDINSASSHSGQTALHAAAKANNTGVVVWLLAHGALATVKDRRGNFPEESVSNNKALLQTLREAHYQQMRQAERKWPQLLVQLVAGASLTDAEWTRLDRRLSELPQDIQRLDQVYHRTYETNPEERLRLERFYSLYCNAYEPFFYPCQLLPACYAHHESDLQAKEGALISDMTQLQEAQQQGTTKPALDNLLGFYNEIAKILTDLRLLRALSQEAFMVARQRAQTKGFWPPESTVGLPQIIKQHVYQATTQGHLDTLKSLWEHYPRLKFWRDEQAGTLLHLAAKQGQPTCLEFLIEQGVVIDSDNAQGLTPLALAVTSPHSDAACVALLLKVSHQLRRVDEQDHTLIHALLLSRHPEKSLVLHQLQQVGLSVAAVTQQGNTALHLAARLGLTDIVVALLHMGAQPDCQNHAGQTPLVLAHANGHVLTALPLEQIALKKELDQLRNACMLDQKHHQQYQTLWADYISRQESFQEEQSLVTRKQQALNQPLIKIFYRQVKRKLTELFGAAKITQSGWVANTRKGVAGQSADVIDIVGQALPLPHADRIIQLLTLGLRVYDRYHIGKANAQIAEIFDSFQAIDQLAEDLAWALTERYFVQISQLTEASAATLGECAVGRIIAFLEKQPLGNTPSIIEQLLDAVARHPIKQGRFAFINQRIATKEGGLNWTDAGIFQRSGVKLPDGRCFVDAWNTKPHTCMRPGKYGFRQGNEEEVKRFTLQAYDPSTVKKGNFPSLFQTEESDKRKESVPLDDFASLNL